MNSFCCRPFFHAARQGQVFFGFQDPIAILRKKYARGLRAVPNLDYAVSL